MAHLVRAGHPVHVLTCTLGEEGEVIPADLLHLDAEHDDALGPHRREELRGAMAELGVTHEVLGEDPERGRLSRLPRLRHGRATASAATPRRSSTPTCDEAAGRVADVVRRVRPAVVVTYDEHGGYGHPDHIQDPPGHLRRRGVPARGGAAGPVCRADARSWAVEDRAWLAEHLPPRRCPGPEPGGRLPARRGRRRPRHPRGGRARTSCRSRRPPCPPRHPGDRASGDLYTLSNDVAARLGGREGFALLDPETGRLAPSGAPGGRRQTAGGAGGGRRVAVARRCSHERPGRRPRAAPGGGRGPVPARDGALRHRGDGADHLQPAGTTTR